MTVKDKTRVRLDDRRLKAITRRLLEDQDATARVGLLAGTDGEVLIRGVVHEFGSRDGNIPERSYMRSAFDANKTKYDQPRS